MLSVVNGCLTCCLCCLLADVELVLGGSSSDFSQQASAVSGSDSGASSSISGGSSCCSEERTASPSGSSLSHSFSTSTADLSSLSAFCLRESHTCVTDDGWRLHIMHVYDPASASVSAAASADAAADATSTSGRLDSSSRRPLYPVLMVPGLASSGEHTFDLLPDHSLVNALVARGYDVWMADLRGVFGGASKGVLPAQNVAHSCADHMLVSAVSLTLSSFTHMYKHTGNGRSQKPSLLDKSTWWTVDDHFLHDVPAVLQYVLAATGAKQVHWVGHSMVSCFALSHDGWRVLVCCGVPGFMRFPTHSCQRRTKTSC